MGGYESYSLLASAVAGFQVPVSSDERVRAWSDGTAIFLPPAVSTTTAVATVVAQAALLHADSLHAPGARAIARSKHADRYLCLEVARATAELERMLPQHLLAALQAAAPKPAPGSAAQSAARAADRTETIAPSPEWFGQLRPSAVVRPERGLGSPPKPGDLASSSTDLPELDEDEAEQTQRSRILELFSAPASQNPLATALQKILGVGRSASESSGGAELPVRGHRAGPVGANAQRVIAPALLQGLFGQTPPVGVAYPEWDCHRRRYRERWCSVSELDPAATVDDDLPSYLDPPLRRELLRLGLRSERHRRQLDGDDLDINTVIELQIDRVSGREPDPRVYQTRLRTGRDLGVLILLDATGSSAEQGEAEASFEQHRALAGRLTVALEQIGDRVATFGFYSRGRGAVRLLRVKNFDDRFDVGAARRLSNLSPSGFTRLGAVIRHGTMITKQRAGTSNQLVVLIGDGFAYDDGYEDRYARQDTRRALLEADRSGIGCVGLRVGGSTDDSFAEIWAGLPSRELRDPSELAGAIRLLLGAALARIVATDRTEL